MKYFSQSAEAKISPCPHLSCPVPDPGQALVHVAQLGRSWTGPTEQLIWAAGKAEETEDLGQGRVRTLQA
jgi:hypothetical protein